MTLVSLLSNAAQRNEAVVVVIIWFVIISITYL
jgi:hypothetical protein